MKTKDTTPANEEMIDGAIPPDDGMNYIKEFVKGLSPEELEYCKQCCNGKMSGGVGEEDIDFSSLED